jgi:hypothetical protein
MICEFAEKTDRVKAQNKVANCLMVFMAFMAFICKCKHKKRGCPRAAS